jgi:hypothetical protein
MFVVLLCIKVVTKGEVFIFHLDIGLLSVVPIFVSVPLTGKDTTIYHTLTQLHPETSYDVEVVATNSFGTSNSSLRLTTVGKLF